MKRLGEREKEERKKKRLGERVREQRLMRFRGREGEEGR